MVAGQPVFVPVVVFVIVGAVIMATVVTAVMVMAVVVVAVVPRRAALMVVFWHAGTLGGAPVRCNDIKKPTPPCG
jgi:hypothetical protein